MSKIVVKSNSGNFLVFFATSKKFLNTFKKYTSISAKLYAKKNNIGILLIDHELISKREKFYKKPTWQKWLILTILKKIIRI